MFINSWEYPLFMIAALDEVKQALDMRHIVVRKDGRRLNYSSLERMTAEDLIIRDIKIDGHGAHVKMLPICKGFSWEDEPDEFGLGYSFRGTVMCPAEDIKKMP